MALNKSKQFLNNFKNSPLYWINNLGDKKGKFRIRFAVADMKAELQRIAFKVNHSILDLHL